MSPQARGRLPDGIAGLTKPELLQVIDAAGIGRENEEIARLYFVDRMPRIDVAAELYLGRATIQRRLPEIKKRMEIATKYLKH